MVKRYQKRYHIATASKVKCTNWDLHRYSNAHYSPVKLLESTVNKCRANCVVLGSLCYWGHMCCVRKRGGRSRDFLVVQFAAILSHPNSPQLPITTNCACEPCLCNRTVGIYTFQTFWIRPCSKLYFKLPYIGLFSKIADNKIRYLVKRYYKDLNVKFVFSSFKVGNLFSVKDSVPDKFRSRIVCNISCAGCSARYVG